MKSKIKQVSITEYLNEMTAAAKKLDSMPSGEARAISIKSLRSSGVLTKSGTVKKNICSVQN